MSFVVTAAEDIPPNRLLSLGDKGRIYITPIGGTPDYRSTGPIKKGSLVRVVIKNSPVWRVEAGEDLDAGDRVEVGTRGRITKYGGNGYWEAKGPTDVRLMMPYSRKQEIINNNRSVMIGYVSEHVKKGNTTRLVRKVAEAPTKKEWNRVIKRIEALEKGAGS